MSGRTQDPLVRLSIDSAITDDGVTPHLTFVDLDILHHRLVAVDDKKGIKLVGWACEAYESGLRKRAKMRLVGEGRN